jgi:hypothetical protein
MPKGFDLKCGEGRTARVWLQGNGGGLTPGQALVLLPPKANEHQNSPAALRPGRQILDAPLEREDRGKQHRHQASGAFHPSREFVRSPYGRAASGGVLAGARRCRVACL